MLNPELIQTSLNNIDYSHLASTLILIASLLPIQKDAIIKRDSERCMAYWAHICRGILTIHHIKAINGKSRNHSHSPKIDYDDKRNLITLCDSSHNAINGKEEKYADRLRKIAEQNTIRAEQDGWVFPDNPYEVVDE